MNHREPQLRQNTTIPDDTLTNKNILNPGPTACVKDEYSAYFPVSFPRTGVCEGLEIIWLGTVCWATNGVIVSTLVVDALLTTQWLRREMFCIVSKNFDSRPWTVLCEAYFARAHPKCRTSSARQERNATISAQPQYKTHQECFLTIA